MQSDRKRKLLAKLRERDGDDCWLCGMKMMFNLPRLPDGPSSWIPTIEHLVEQSRGGTSAQYNCVLAHRKCNSIINGMFVWQKLEKRRKMRQFWKLRRERGQFPSYYQLLPRELW